MIGERSDGSEVSAVKSQDGVGSKLGSDGNVHGVGEIDSEVEVVSPDSLRGVEDGGCYFRQDCAACSHPVPDVIDGLMCSIAAEDPTRHMVDFAE